MKELNINISTIKKKLQNEDIEDTLNQDKSNEDNYLSKNNSPLLYQHIGSVNTNTRNLRKVLTIVTN